MHINIENYLYWDISNFNTLIIGHLNTLCTSNDICVCYVNHKIVATSNYSCQLIFHHSNSKTDFQKYEFEFIYITYYISNLVLVTVCTGLECVCLQSHRHIKIKTLQSLLCKHSHWVHAADQAYLLSVHGYCLSSDDFLLQLEPAVASVRVCVTFFSYQCMWFSIIRIWD